MVRHHRNLFSSYRDVPAVYPQGVDEGGEWRCTHAKLDSQTLHPLPRIASLGLYWNKGDTLRQATFLQQFLQCSLVDAVGATALSQLIPRLWCYWLPDVDVDQSGSSSSSIAVLLLANTGREWRGEAIAAGCRLCRSHANSILWRIVEATKVATWSHPLADSHGKDMH